MKFEIPEIEVKKFDVADILTSSSEPGPISQADSINEGSCNNNEGDFGVPDCV